MLRPDAHKNLVGLLFFAGVICLWLALLEHLEPVRVLVYVGCGFFVLAFLVSLGRKGLKKLGVVVGCAVAIAGVIFGITALDAWDSVGRIVMFGALAWCLYSIIASAVAEGIRRAK
jgi:hypothetical protein